MNEVITSLEYITESPYISDMKKCISRIISSHSWVVEKLTICFVMNEWETIFREVPIKVKITL